MMRHPSRHVHYSFSQIVVQRKIREICVSFNYMTRIIDKCQKLLRRLFTSDLATAILGTKKGASKKISARC